MGFLDTTRKKIVNHMAEITTMLVVSLLGFFLHEITTIVQQQCVGSLSSRQLLTLIMFSIFLILLLVSLVFYFLIKDKLTLKYGVYWDKDKNPYCPCCKKPVHADEWVSINGFGYRCNDCNYNVALKDYLGNRILAKDVFPLKNK